MRSAQIAMEFLLFTVMSIFTVLILVGVGLNFTQSKLTEQRQEELLDLSRTVQDEFLLATEVEPGYHREFNLPFRLERGAYWVKNDNSSVTMWAKSVNISFDIPPSIGSLQLGTNLLVNDNGTIYINP